MEGPKAIETAHLGCRFRSRIEARWASFFDALGIPWEYEKEGYSLRAGYYLPDFWMPAQDCWIEIKGSKPSDTEIALASNLCAATHKHVYLFHGAIHVPLGAQLPPSAICFYPVKDESSGCMEVQSDDTYYWCQCHFCEALGICFQGRSNRLPCKSAGCMKAGGDPDKGYNFSSQTLVAAYSVASSSRFEFGEGR